ncbi:BrnA antitoxin family protein [Dehalococcoidia bacterium]|nr:BrnA antitoxin family protein [Dehalococcoidia bacterium]MCL0076880.1 BrnA antitoxin family protein [Dehalococcoidia bacterium]MCL0078507.1 BrnA antitoxin family protein [Dehalococcoidia bacterium]MCL0080339.1 BrnA antitoxin family protein [Dehalococcoidia bacterium]MCL0088905.1 BrnA antitoxin family protein [Dehalococcoidia bacterium]
MKNMKKNKIPKFRTEEEERNFWSSHDSTEYIDWSKAKALTLSNLKPSIRSISIRLPEMMVEELKLLANKRDIPYQSLMKIYISEKVEEELHRIS